MRNIAFILLMGLSAKSVWARDTKAWDHGSSYGADALVASALIIPAVKQDWSGDLQAGGSIGAAFVTTFALKEIFPEERPDHSDNKSFPSSHTSVSFAAAASLQERYGWQIGLPAQALATAVGVARVEARKHHWYDVAAGAAIGETSGFLITSKYDDSVQIMPWADSSGGGMDLKMHF